MGQSACTPTIIKSFMAVFRLSYFLLLIVLTTEVSGIPVDGNTRIRGGSDAEVGEFPYIISIRRIANAFKHMCAGVLVDPQWVLTSAFCVSEVGTYSIDAVGGEHNLVIPSVHEQIRGVDLILQHPNYTHSDASVGGMATPESNDVALVRLKSPMTETDFVKAVTLAEKSPSSGECITAGWGTKTVTSLVMTSVLQKSVANFVDKDECEQTYSTCNNCPDISEEAFCTRGADSAPCFGYMWGDAGGPLVCNGELTGVVSWGVGCGEGDFPWVNTDVVFHKQWIEETMKANKRL